MKKAVLKKQTSAGEILGSGEQTTPKVSPTGKQILEYLQKQGGTSAVGVLCGNRSTMIKNLRKLESTGLIICLSQPEKLKPHVNSMGLEGHSLTCGIWQLADETQPEEKARTCDFCGFTELYSNFPKGSICFDNITACAPCLKADKTAEFRKQLKKQKKQYNQRFDRQISWKN